MSTYIVQRKSYKVMIAMFFAVYCWLSAGFAGEVPKDFQEANLLYKQGKFSEAADLYLKVIQSDSFREYAELRFNLANAQFRTGKISDAIYNYERALALNPFYSDARFNLNQARAKIQYKIEDKRNLFIRFHDLALKWLSSGIFLGIALFFSLIFLVSAIFWMRNSEGLYFWAFPRAEVFALCLLFAALSGANFLYDKLYAEAIVLADEVEVRYGPSMDNQSLMKLGGGLKVFVVDQREDWSRVVTWNGETGWIKNSEIGRIK